MCNILCIRAYKTIGFDISIALCDFIPWTSAIIDRSIAYLAKQSLAIPFWGHHDADDFTDDLLPETAKYLKKQLFEDSKLVWSEHWLSCAKNEWVSFLFPTLEHFDCILTSSIPVDFWTIQAITGHGCFGSYLKEYRRRVQDRCLCESAVESPLHVFTECSRYKSIGSVRRPLSWTHLDDSHLRYMRAVVVDLWEIEQTVA